MSPDASDGYREQFEIVLKRWRLLTGDPPIVEITTQLLAKFRDALAKSRGLHAWQRMTPGSVHRFLSYIHRILVKAGPAGPRNWDAAGILPRIPWIKPPRRPPSLPRLITPKQLSDVYQAAICMTQPRIDGFKPAAWWRALLVVAYNTGLHRGTLFSLRTDHIDWDNSRIVIPGEILKSGRPHISPLNQTALLHLRNIRTSRELIFPWPFHLSTFHTTFHKLQAEVNIKNHFGLKHLRQTHATVLWEHSPHAAQLSLGHTAIGVTQRHYVQSTGIVARAVNDLPQPAAFTATVNGTAGRKLR